MDDQIQKRNSESLRFQQQPELFLQRLGEYLATLQLVTRMPLAEAELSMWKETLKAFSYQAIERALGNLVMNPPKFKVDGEIQRYTGMPKLQDVLLELGKIEAEDDDLAIKAYQEREKERLLREGTNFAAEVKAHPEDYEPFNIGEFLREEMNRHQKHKLEGTIGPLPEEIRRDELKEQYAEHTAGKQQTAKDTL